MTECYFMPTPGEFYPEDPPEEKEEITRQSWSDPEWAKEHGLPPGYHEERGLVPFPKVDFEMLAHTYMLQDEKDFSVDYQVYQRRADGTLYLRRSRYQGPGSISEQDHRETILRVPDWRTIVHVIALDGGGYFEPEMDWIVDGCPPDRPGFEDVFVVDREELVDTTVETMREGRVRLLDDAPDELYEGLSHAIEDYDSRHGDEDRS